MLSTRASRITVDGLWRCLCPSVDAADLARALSTPYFFTSDRRRRAVNQCLRRPLSSVPPATRELSDRQHPPPRPEPPQWPRLTLRPMGRERRGHVGDVSGRTEPSRSIPAAHPQDPQDLQAFLSTLRTLRDNPAVTAHAVAWAKRLRRQVSEANLAGYDPLVFDVLIRSQCHTAGTVGAVRDLLQEMQDIKLAPTPEIYHSVLSVLAVHPDYRLRNQILRDMSNRRIELTLEGHENVAVGLLRDGQYELALDKLEQMARDKMQVSAWLYDIFTYTFAQLGFHDEVFQIMSHRLERTGWEEPPLNLWYFLLDACSKSLHYDGTKYVWNRVVETNQLNPPDGVVLNVLNTASGGRDTALATQAIRLLAARGTKLGLHHYEPLVECYAGSDDLENALRILCIMARAGIEPDSGSTRSVHRLLSRLDRDEVVRGAVRLLFRCKESGDVPIAAFNVVLEGMLAHGASGEALGLYKNVRLVCASGPVRETFDLLLRMHEPDPKVAVFLAAEMAALGIRPGRETYDHLVRIHAGSGKLQVALRYLDEMAVAFGRELKRRGWLVPTTAIALLRRCIQDEHEATWAIIEECEARGLAVADAARKLLEAKRSGAGSGSWGPRPAQTSKPTVVEEAQQGETAPEPGRAAQASF